MNNILKIEMILGETSYNYVISKHKESETSIYYTIVKKDINKDWRIQLSKFINTNFTIIGIKTIDDNENIFIKINKKTSSDELVSLNPNLTPKKLQKLAKCFSDYWDK